MNRLLHVALLAVLVPILSLAHGAVAAEAQKYVIKPLADKKVAQLPEGPLYWRVETFPSLADAKTAIGPDGWDPAAVRYRTTTSLVAVVDGTTYVATLGPAGEATPGGTKVAEVGPVPPVRASEYLLRLNFGSGPPGSSTPIHSHPGSESFYVIRGRLGQRTPDGTAYVDTGQTMNGHAAHTTMQVFNAGTTELQALIMFVVDAGQPFSVPAGSIARQSQ
jgi:quercetin dioxygenase-like cupin family protein